MNARQGIETSIATCSCGVVNLFRGETMNARQGIETQNQVRAFGAARVVWRNNECPSGH